MCQENTVFGVVKPGNWGKTHKVLLSYRSEKLAGLVQYRYSNYRHHLCSEKQKHWPDYVDAQTDLHLCFCILHIKCFIISRVLAMILKIGVKMLSSTKSWSFTILFYLNMTFKKVGVRDKKNKQIQWIFVPRLWNLFWGVLSLADKRIAPWMAVSRLPRQRSRSDTQPHFKSTRS